MNHFEGLRRITVIVSVVATILTSVYFIMLNNPAHQEYSKLVIAANQVKLQKDFLKENDKDFVAKYTSNLKKDAFENLNIVTIEDRDTDKEYTILWSKKELMQASDFELLIKNKLYLEGADHEKEAAKMLLGYLTELTDSSAIDSKLKTYRLRAYLFPIAYGIASFAAVWIVFYSILYIVLGFKQQR